MIVLAVNNKFLLGMSLESVEATIAAARESSEIRLTVGERAAVNAAMTSALVAHGKASKPSENKSTEALQQQQEEEDMRGSTRQSSLTIRQSTETISTTGRHAYDWRRVGRSDTYEPDWFCPCEYRSKLRVAMQIHSVSGPRHDSWRVCGAPVP